MHPVVLGIIQGLTEFLPVSSSGHLLIIPSILGWNPEGLSFDVALNTGTFIAALLYFFPTWWRILTKGILGRQSEELKLLGLLVVATIPAAVVGFLGEKAIVNHLRQPLLAAIMLIIFGVILWLADKCNEAKRTKEDLTWKDALGIGLAQCLALIPGVSRSGITMTTGRFLGLKREEVAEFSFLLLAPISFGAAITQMSAIIHTPDPIGFLLGTITSFIVGLGAIHFLLKLVKKYGFAPYMWYRIIAGVIFIILILGKN